jgi:hypothetical protein
VVAQPAQVQEPKDDEGLGVKLEPQPHSAGVEGPQYSIVEIMKGGKMVQVKVPKQEDVGAASSDALSPTMSPMQVNPSIQGMTNLQRKKQANKAKMREMDKKQS